MNTNNNKLLVELLAEVKRLHERLDIIIPNEPAVSEDIGWEAMFEHMVYVAGKYTIMGKALLGVYEVISNPGLSDFITPKVFTMLSTKPRRVATGTKGATQASHEGEMLTVPGEGCVYVIRFDVQQSTRPAIKTVTHVATITADQRGMGHIVHSDDFASIIKKAYELH